MLHIRFSAASKLEPDIARTGHETHSVGLMPEPAFSVLV
jgi:hypothetical protein